jgi:hypothetical protein
MQIEPEVEGGVTLEDDGVPVQVEKGSCRARAFHSFLIYPQMYHASLVYIQHLYRDFKLKKLVNFQHVFVVENILKCFMHFMHEIQFQFPCRVKVTCDKLYTVVKVNYKSVVIFQYVFVEENILKYFMFKT